jgi:Domain of unknown function (DUF4905)
MLQKVNLMIDSVIWNLSFNKFSEKKIGVIEVRDESKREASFKAFDLHTGVIIQKKIILPERWWISMIGVFKDILLINRYPSDNQPIPEEIIAIDVITGKILWQKEKVQILGVRKNGIVCQQENETFSLLDFLTGELSEEEDILEEKDLLQSFSPILYSENDEYFSTIFRFLHRLLSVDAQKNIEYLEIDNKIVISYYIYHEDLLQNWILVTNRQREILLNDVMNESEGVGIDTFSVESQTLFYLKNKNQLIGYELF